MLHRSLYQGYMGTALSGMAGALCLALGSSGAHALPEGGVVAGGDIAVLRLDERQLRVEQRSNRGIVNWQSFDLNTGEHAHFQQPSASSVTLNRVVGSEQRASQIMGKLTATGKVAIVNPNGIVFGKDATVDVAGLVASTADIADHEFLRGGGAFSMPGRKDASIVNEGSIKVREAGMAALVAPAVRNSGTIAARLGKVHLAGASTHTLSFDSNNVLSVAVDDAALHTMVSNDGIVAASGGQVLLTAAAAENVLNGLVESRGAVDVSSASGKGGVVTMTAPKVGVSGVINADGKTEGGSIFVGGDYLGGQGEQQYSKQPIKTAKRVHIADDALITANATTAGKGGTAIVWSDEYTYFGGRIEAKGGYLSGDGGFIETSSKDNLQAFGLADASAPNGKAGVWLLDPNNITITNTADANVSTSGTNPLTYDTTNDSAVVTVSSIQTALNAGTSVTIQTSTAGANTQAGNIDVNSAISKSTGSDATLTLRAHNNININDVGITSTSNKLHLNLFSDSDGSNGGRISIESGAVQKTINTNGGDFVASGGTDPLGTGYARGHSADSTGISLGKTIIETGSGNILMRGYGRDTDSYGYGIYAEDSGIIRTTTGTITLIGTAGILDGAGITLETGMLITTASGAVSLTGVGGAGAAGWFTNGIENYGGSITSTGSGTITLTGTGRGTGSGGGSIGVIAGTISTVNGAVTITGLGSTASTGGFNYGISGDGTITSTGSGTITLAGTGGGTGAGDYNYGVSFEAGGVLDGAGIATVNGAVTVTGQGSTTADDSNHGVLLWDGARLRSTGSGTITINGTGGGAGAGSQFNFGVNVDSNGVAGGGITSISAAIALNGQRGANSHGLALYSTGTRVESTGSATIALTGMGASGYSDIYNQYGSPTIGGNAMTGAITLNADTVALNTGTVIRTQGNILVKPRTANTTIGLGGGAGTLNLTDAELSYFNADGTFTIGDLSSGTGAVAITSWDYSGKSHDVIVVGGATTISGGVIGGSNHFTAIARTGNLTVNASSAISAQDITLTASAGNVATNSALTGSGHITLTAGGGNITQNSGAAISTSTAGRNIILRASNNIASYGNLTSQGGYIHLLSDSDGSNAGSIYLQGNTVTTNGGAFVASGGLDPTTGYAAGSSSTYKEGVFIGSSTLSVGGGNILLRGRGWNGSGVDYKSGIHLDSASTIGTTGLGNITLVGIGSPHVSGDLNYGVWQDGSISLVDGALSISGTGGSVGSWGSIGVLVTGAMAATGTGTITIAGMGMAGGWWNLGVELYSSLTSNSGAITIAGTGGSSTGGNNYGVLLYGAGVTSNSGAVTITGTGGSTTSGGDNYGVILYSAGAAISSAGNIVVTGRGGSGSGSSNTGIVLDNSGQIAATGAGTVTLTGTGAAGTFDNVGIDIKGSGTEVSAVNGAITLSGTGGSGSNTTNVGVWVRDSARMRTTGSGAITLTGRGGSGTDYNHGIEVKDSAEVSTVSGAISLTGTGGIASGQGSIGTRVYNGGRVASTSGAITLTGTGGGGTGSLYGVLIDWNNAEVTTGGNITLNGTGGSGSGWDNRGVGISDSGKVRATGSGSLTISGSGPAVTGGGGSHGIMVGHSSEVSTVNGNLQLTGARAASGGIWNHGVRLEDFALIRSTGSGNIAITGTAGFGGNGYEVYSGTATNTANVYATTGTLTITSNGFFYNGVLDTIYGSASTTGAIRINTDGADLARATFRTSGDIIFSPYTASTTIGINGGAGTLQITNSGYLDRISPLTLPSRVILGSPDTGTGAVTIGSTWNISGYDFPIEVVGGSVTGGAITMGGQALTLIARNGGDVTLNSPITKSTGVDATLTLRADNNITLNSGVNITSASNRVHIVLNSDRDASGSGAVSISGSTLSTNGGNIIMRGGSDPTTGYAAGSSGTYNHGVYIWGSTLTAGSGNILLRGRGWSGSGADRKNGIHVDGGSSINTTTGSITLNGIGSTSGTDRYHVGVDLSLSSSTDIYSQDGAIAITGVGGTSSDEWTVGIAARGRIYTTGSGAIALNGTGGSGTRYVQGIYLGNNNAEISSVNGAINLNGVGGMGTTYENSGIAIWNTGKLRSTGTGAITLIGTGGTGIGYIWGIDLRDSGTEITSAQGAITLTGHGGSSAGREIAGILLYDGARVISTASAAITLSGTGGSNGSSASFGIDIRRNGAGISTVDGNVLLTGVAGGNGTSSDNMGIALGWVDNGCCGGAASIRSTGTGTITLNGTGGSGTDGNTGVYLSGSSSEISSVDGAISVTGQASSTATGIDNRGIDINQGGYITSLGAASVTLAGTGGASGSVSADGIAIYVWSSGYGGVTGITTVNGDVSMSGIGGGGGNSNGIELYSDVGVRSTGSGSITLTGIAASGQSDLNIGVDGGTALDVGSSSMTGNIILNADTIDLWSPVSIRTQGNITVSPRTASTTIGVGNGASGALNLDTNELGYFHADGTLTIGDLSAGTGAVDLQSWDFSGKNHDVIVVGGATSISGGVTGGSNHFTSIARSGSLILSAGSPITANDITLSTSNAGVVYLASDLAGLGDITVTGGDVSQASGTAISSSGANKNILLQAAHTVFSYYGSITSNGGDK
jgi:filamentous hemagglutinin family protein